MLRLSMLTRRFSGADSYICTCDTDVCRRHFTGIPFSAEDNFLTGEVSFIQDDRWPYIDQGSNHSFGQYASSIFMRSYSVLC